MAEREALQECCRVYWQEDLLNGLQAISLKVMGIMGWSAEGTQVFLAGVRQDVKDTNIHAYLPMYVLPP